LLNYLQSIKSLTYTLKYGVGLVYFIPELKVWMCPEKSAPRFVWGLNKNEELREGRNKILG
jgi:hypothetical protein